MKIEEIEFFRATFMAVVDHYPGFEEEAMKRNMNEIFDMAIRYAEVLDSDE